MAPCTILHAGTAAHRCAPPAGADLAAQIQENVEAVLRMPPASGGAAATRGGKAGESKELRELRAQIDKDQQLLIQFAEEKVQLAVQVGLSKRHRRSARRHSAPPLPPAARGAVRGGGGGPAQALPGRREGCFLRTRHPHTFPITWTLSACPSSGILSPRRPHHLTTHAHTCALTPPHTFTHPHPAQGYDLLELHVGQADLDIVHLESEVGGAGAGSVNAHGFSACSL